MPVLTRLLRQMLLVVEVAMRKITLTRARVIRTVILAVFLFIRKTACSQIQMYANIENTFLPNVFRFPYFDSSTTQKYLTRCMEISPCYTASHDKWVPVTTAWRVLGLRMEERPPDMEGSCECTE
jgi:hypothetical protein